MPNSCHTVVCQLPVVTVNAWVMAPDTLMTLAAAFSAADMPVRSLMAALGPIDKALISVYIIVAVALSTRVLIKYKSIFIDYLIKRQRTLERGAGDEGKTSAAAAAAAAATVSSSDSIDSGSDSNDGSAPALDNTALICSEGVGRQMVIALCPRPTSPQGRAAAAATLSSSSTTASRAPAAAGVGGTKSAAAAVPRKSGVAGTAFAVASDVARKSSRYSSLVKPGWNLEGKSADDLERLLLPLDRCGEQLQLNCHPYCSKHLLLPYRSI